MAVVGEAHIIVRAITTQVKDDIKKGFSGVDDVVNKAGKQIRDSFSNDFAREAEFARKAWQKLTKTGFVLQTAIGAILAGASSLALSLGSLVGAVGGAAASLGALSGILAALPLALITSKLAFSGIGEAISAADKKGGGYGKTLREINEELQQLAFDQEEAALSVERAGINLERARENLLRSQDLPTTSRARREAELEAREAELAYRRALDRKNDLEDEANSPRAARGGGAAAADPFADLLPSQKQFAIFLISLKDELKLLKAASADSFLPVLQEQISRLLSDEAGIGSFFDVVERGLGVIGGALGQSVTRLFDSLTSPGNLGKLSTVFDNSAVSIEKFGTILGSVYDSFLSITTGSNASTQKFLDFLSNRAGRFADFLNVKEATGELESFFNRAGNLAAEVGGIFGNVFGFIGDLIEDNFSPNQVSGGSYLLSWLRDATAGWNNLQETVGESEFSSFLLSAAVNTRSILASFKPLIKALGQLGANRNVKDTFDSLAKGGPALGEIIAAGAEAGPLFADLLVNLTEIVAALADSSAIKVFFSTLNDFAKVFNDLLKNEAIKNLLNTIGQVVAFGLAIQTVRTTALFVFKVIAGALLPVQAALIKTGIVSTTTAKTIGASISKFLGPIGVGVGIFAAVVAGGKALGDQATRIKTEGLGAQDALLRVASALDVDGVQLLATAFKDVNGQFEVAKTVNGESLRDYDNDVEHLRFTLQDALTDVDTFKLLLDATNNSLDDGVNAINDVNDSTRIATEEGFKNIGTTLATIAQTNLPLAIAKFSDLAKGMELTEQQTTDLYNLMGDDFKNAIMNAGVAVGIYIDEQAAMDIALGRGAVGSVLLAEGLEDVGEEAQGAREKIESLKNSILNFGSAQLDANAADRAFEAALDDLESALKKNGKTLDITTEKGRANEAALDGLARAGLAAATAQFELTGSGPDLEASLLRLREETIEGAKAFGLSTTEAENLADQLDLSEYNIEIHVKALTAEEAKTAAAVSEALMNSAMTSTDLFFSNTKKAESGMLPYGKDGGLMSGGEIRRLYNGGMVSGPGGPRSDSIPAMLSNGEFVVNAASTEKYLPLLKALNSEGIGGARLANGGMPGATINMTVNAAPGMNTSEIVNEVSRRIAFELRSGVA
jgi:hypothetical protein